MQVSSPAAGEYPPAAGRKPDGGSVKIYLQVKDTYF